MSKQIFRKNIPVKYLFDLLEIICLKSDNYYQIDYNSYRKLIYHKLDKKMMVDLIGYYHYSKQFYLTREMTYKSFTNILRHICKSLNIMFSSKMKYNESKYNIHYYVFFNAENGNFIRADDISSHNIAIINEMNSTFEVEPITAATLTEHTEHTEHTTETA